MPRQPATAACPHNRNPGPEGDDGPPGGTGCPVGKPATGRLRCFSPIVLMRGGGWLLGWSICGASRWSCSACCGAVLVALEVARALGAPLDVIVVRKLEVPFQPELGMGAVGEGGVRVINREVVRLARVPAGEVAAVQAREQAGGGPGRAVPGLPGT